MKRKRALKISLTDESRLEERASWTASPLRLGLTVGVVSLLLIALGGALVLFTPLRRITPGYMPREQRAATEMAFMRIDSIREALRVEREYMANFIQALDSRRKPVMEIDSAALRQEIDPDLLTDSLMAASDQEVRFTLAMQRREGFNTSVLAPLAAEGMVFYFPASSGVYGSLGTDGNTQRVIVGKDACIRSVADGSVVGVTRSTRERGYIIWIQHDNGFLSRYSHLGMPLVDQGSVVEGGEAIALPAAGNGIRGDRIDIQLWHDGERLAPRRFLPEG